MNELLKQLITPELQAAFTVVLVLLVILYILSIVWVVRDAYMRGSYWYIWAVVALVPLLGIIAYCLLRPPLLQIDRDEQELEIALKQRELMKYGECANCGYPVEADFVLCPNCHQRLKNLCPSCNHALDPSWTVCPYCATPANKPQKRRRSSAQGRSTSAQPVETPQRAPHAAGAQAVESQQRTSRAASIQAAGTPQSVPRGSAQAVETPKRTPRPASTQPAEVQQRTPRSRTPQTNHPGQ